MSNINLIAFLDAAQRTIIGELELETNETLTIKNPVVVNIVPQHDQATGRPTGGMALQLLPAFFKEFQGDKNSPVIYEYQKTQITKISFAGGFDFKLYGQYAHIFTQEIAAQPVNNGAQDKPILNLFDDDVVGG